MINLPGCIVLPPWVNKNVQIQKKKKWCVLGGTPNIMGIWWCGVYSSCLDIYYEKLTVPSWKNVWTKNYFKIYWKKILKFVKKNFNGLAAAEYIIQMTSDHVSMLIKTWNNIWHYGYVKIKKKNSLHPNGHLSIIQSIKNICKI